MVRTVTFGGVRWSVDEVESSKLPSWRFWDAWERGEFEPDTLSAIDRFMRPGATIVDIGAWIGPASLWASRRRSHVVAVEPDPAAAMCLRRNIAVNNANVDIFEGAIGPITGTTFIQPHEYGWGSSMTRVASEGLSVPCLSLPDLFDIYDIDDCAMVKMDVEGAECEILETALPFLAKHGVPILVAMHQPWWSKDVEPSWFKDFSTVEGVMGGWNQVLAVP